MFTNFKFIFFFWSKQIVWNNTPHLNTARIEKAASDYIVSIEAADLETKEGKKYLRSTTVPMNTYINVCACTQTCEFKFIHRSSCHNMLP